MQEFLQREFFGNMVITYLTALGIFITGLLVVTIFRYIILKRLKKLAAGTSTKIDDFIISGIEKTAIPLFYFASLYAALRVITFTQKISQGIHLAAIFFVTYFLIRIIIAILKYSLQAYLRSKEEADSRQKQLNGIITLFSFLIWGVGLIFLLDNLGFKVSAVIAGLGVGGIAIALAAQTILGDLFNYFVIFFDRPFEIGDTIMVDDKIGAVEYIGIKTTRIRSLSGEQIVFSNSNLTSSRVHNFKRMERRRVVFKFNVDYSTVNEEIKNIPIFLKRIISEYSEAVFDRSHFASYGESGLVFETVYYINTPDYNRYMDIQQEINLKIHKEFEDRGIKFAFPVRNLNVTTKIN